MKMIGLKLMTAGIVMISLSYPVLSDSGPTGWLWYKEKKEPIPVIVEKKKEDKKEGRDSASLPPTALERLAVLQKRFEEAKAEAILTPNLESTTTVRRLHDEFLMLSSKFQEMWTLSEVLDNQRPLSETSPKALEIKRDLEEKELTRDLKALSQTHGLLFVFKKGCPHCEGFAPLVVKFARSFGFELEGLSAGDGCYEGMNCTRSAPAISAVNPKGEYPLLFIVNPKTHDVIPLSRGYASWSDLLANAQPILKYLKGDAS